MPGLFGDPWSPTGVVEPNLLRTGGDQAKPSSDQQLTEAEAILAHIDAVAATLQPLDSDLTAIAALATTSFGRGLLALLDAAALTALVNVFTTTLKGLVPAPGASTGKFLRDDATWATPAGGSGLGDGDYGDIVVSGGGTAINIDSAVLSAFIRTVLDDPDAATARATLGLVIGTDVQAFDSDLSAIAALATTSFGRSLLALVDAAALRSTAGLVIGTDVQAHDTDLDAIAALATTSFGRSLLTSASAAALKVTLAIAATDISGLGYFATGTDAANLTGTVAAARLPAFSGDATSTAGSSVLTVGSATPASGTFPITAPAATDAFSDIRGDAGKNRMQRFTNRTGSVRWAIGAENTAESGGSAGSNFVLDRYDDLGGFAARVFTVTRSTGNVAFAAALSAASISATGNISGVDITTNGVGYFKQAAPISKSAAATLLIADLLTGIIQYTGAAASLTLPTGTLTDAGIQSGGLANDRGFEWAVINTGSGTCTIAAGTNHTIVGLATIAAGSQGRFWTRKTAANTFVSYRTA